MQVQVQLGDTAGQLEDELEERRERAADQGAVSVDDAGGGVAGEVEGEVTVVVVGVCRAARHRAQVGPLRVESIAHQIGRHWEWPPATGVVRRAPLCIRLSLLRVFCSMKCGACLTALLPHHVWGWEHSRSARHWSPDYLH